jgi:hypothetical protein
VNVFCECSSPIILGPWSSRCAHECVGAGSGLQQWLHMPNMLMLYHLKPSPVEAVMSCRGPLHHNLPCGLNVRAAGGLEVRPRLLQVAPCQQVYLGDAYGGSPQVHLLVALPVVCFGPGRDGHPCVCWGSLQWQVGCSAAW